MKGMSRRAWTARVSAAFGLAVAASQFAAPVSAATLANGWSGTHTLAFPAVRNGVKLGTLAAATPLHIVVSLTLSDRAGLESFLAARATPGNPLYRAKLTPDQFVARYSPSLAQVAAVTTYLKAYGFSNIQVAPNRLLIEADASAASASSAFDTELSEFRIGERTAFANTRDVHVPTQLGGTVLSVLGLQNVDEMHTMNVRGDSSASTNATTKTYIPTQFPIAYNALGAPDGSGTDMAIISEGNMSQTITDLRTFESKYGLAQVPVTTVTVGRAVSLPVGFTEWDIDSQDMTAMAGNSSTSPGVKSLTFYAASSLADSALTPTFNRAVTDNIARGINVSLGGCESSSYSDGAMASDDQIFQQAMSQGQTFFVSSGDSGSEQCGSGSPSVSYPASSPYVLAVGGTSLYTDGSYNYVSESAWSGGGGGVSQYETAASWQQQYLGATARPLPDFAMDADPNTGAVVINAGHNVTWGGTSLAAPLAAGVWARFETLDSNAIGFAPPEMYYIAKYISSPQLPFHDVTSGSNGDYSATTGFDYTTGYGSFNVGAILTDIGYSN